MRLIVGMNWQKCIKIVYSALDIVGGKCKIAMCENSTDGLPRICFCGLFWDENGPNVNDHNDWNLEELKNKYDYSEGGMKTCSLILPQLKKQNDSDGILTKNRHQKTQARLNVIPSILILEWLPKILVSSFLNFHILNYNINARNRD